MRYVFWKEIIDRVGALLLLVLVWPFLIIAFLFATADSFSNGFFFQKRIGQYGRLFTIYKLKTIHPKTRKISSIGRVFRKSKLDELPQLFNILKGDMSFVGPRPDIEGYYDALEGEDRRVLNLKPGITSEASLKYRNEEYVLSTKGDPLKYNDEVIFPDKVKMNLEYLEKMSFSEDIRILTKTIFCMLKK